MIIRTASSNSRIHKSSGDRRVGWVSVEGTACSLGIGDARSESAHMTIAVEGTSSHGFADLSLTARITKTQRKDNAYSDTGKRTARTVVRHDCKSYGIDMFRNFRYPRSAMK